MTDARALLSSLVGRTITTAAGRPNTILRIDGTDVLVGTTRSPLVEPVPIAWVQDAIDRLQRTGDVEISVDSLGHRSAFVGAVLLSLTGSALATTSPPRVIRADVREEYRGSAIGELNTWWEGYPAEVFWLEITDRPDVGVDLHAPQRDARGGRSSGYSLIWHVARGDVVFHYERDHRAITGWSRAIGSAMEAPVIWLSHRATTRRRLVRPRAQPGWWLDLEGPFPLDAPVTLTELRENGDAIRRVLEDLQARVSGALYFPFFFYGGRHLRPMQPYLNKLPASIVELVPSLANAARVAATSGAPDPHTESGEPPTGVGAVYRLASVSGVGELRTPFEIDPTLVERGLQGHAHAQNQVAAALRATGIEPRSPRPDEPSFDLAWEVDGVVYVAEVKSITLANEERQLRLGLGQVLRYREILRRRHGDVRAVLVPEMAPTDPTWRDLCSELDVTLTTPAEFVATP